MARLKDREKAIALRKEKQMSYSQIKKILGLSKSTLSYWLREFPLPEKRIKHLQQQGWKRSEAAIERFRNTMREKRERRLKEVYKIQRKKILPLTKHDLFMAGLFLYWGEGSKTQNSLLSISNTDPSIVIFFINWLVKALKIPRKKIKIQIQLYQDMDVKEKMNFWSKTLKIPLSQFTKPYIKKTSSKRINHKGDFGHGTCSARVGNAMALEKILMSLEVIKNKYKNTRP